MVSTRQVTSHISRFVGGLTALQVQKGPASELNLAIPLWAITRISLANNKINYPSLLIHNLPLAA